MSPASSSASSGPSPSAAARAGGFRWAICGLLFFSVAVNYIDRLVIGILKGPLSEQLHWTENDYANIAAAFQFAYAFGYLFGGRVMDRLGVKRGLPLFVLAWSFAATAHGLCGLIPVDAQFSFALPWFSWADRAFVWVTLAGPVTMLGFMGARMALGLSEGGNFPGAIKTVAEWFPVRERALATGIFNAGTNVGAVVCPVAVPWMYAHWGWPSTFYVTGGTGFAWFIAWKLLYDTPERHSRLSAAERDYILAGQPPVVAETKASISWLELLRHRAVWGYVIASILAGPVWNIYQFFLPDFLDKRFHLDLQEIGYWTGAFYFLAAFGGVGGGWLAGRLLGRGWTLNAARKITLLICAVAVVPIFVAPYLPQVWLTVFVVGLAGSAHQGWSANLFSFVSDTMPKHAVGAVVGLGGFVSYFTGGLVAKVIGWVLEATGSYVSIFAAASTMYVLSLVILHALVPRIAGPASGRPVPS